MLGASVGAAPSRTTASTGGRNHHTGDDHQGHEQSGHDERRRDGKPENAARRLPDEIAGRGRRRVTVPVARTHLAGIGLSAVLHGLAAALRGRGHHLCGNGRGQQRSDECERADAHGC